MSASMADDTKVSHDEKPRVDDGPVPRAAPPSSSSHPSSAAAAPDRGRRTSEESLDAFLASNAPATTEDSNLDTRLYLDDDDDVDDDGDDDGFDDKDVQGINLQHRRRRRGRGTGGAPFVSRAYTHRESLSSILKRPIARLAIILIVLFACVGLAGKSNPEGTRRVVGYVKDKTTKYVYGGGAKTGSGSSSEAKWGTARPPVHVAVEESAGHHSEVWPSFVYTLSRMANVKTSVYVTGGPSRPRKNKMLEIIGPFFNSSSSLLSGYGALSEAVVNGDPERGEVIDVVISTTCSNTISNDKVNSALLHAWDARPAGRKFRIVCILHHTSPGDVNKLVPKLNDWVNRDSIVMVGLSDHTRDGISRAFGEMAIRARVGHGRSASYAGTPVYTLVPIFPVPAPVASKGMDEMKRPSQAVIQGTITHYRRNYNSIFDSLDKHIRADPQLWGYRVGSEPEEAFQVDPSVSDPFQLLLLGHNEEGPDFIPKSLVNVVSIKKDLPFPEYYDTIHNSQLLIPTFSNSDYYSNAASSSIAAAVIAKTPVLASRYHLTTYTYLDERGVVVRPDNVEPIEAIARLRSNGTTLGNKRFQILNDRQDPLLPAFSWPRTAQQAEDMSEKIFKMNVKVMDRCIRGNLPDYSFVHFGGEFVDLHENETVEDNLFY